MGEAKYEYQTFDPRTGEWYHHGWLSGGFGTPEQWFDAHRERIHARGIRLRRRPLPPEWEEVTDHREDHA